MSERAPLPEVVARPESGHVLVLAPHADDDVIGCGGTLCKHALSGDPVKVIVVFSGEAGDPDGRYDPQEYRELRRREALAAGEEIELIDYEFWDYPEGHEPAPAQWREAVERLAGRVAAFNPDIVYAPWVGEHHIDHHVVGRTARMALAQAGFRGAAWGYEVWTPLIATLIVDISDVFERKKAALEEHKSQLAYRDLAHNALALSANRAIYLERGGRYGEAFRPLGEPTAEDEALLRG